MCRHLAYLGAPVTLADLILDPPYGLLRQSWAPRRQRHGVVNADGFGAGWYVASRPEPVRYRRAQPIWTDASFSSLAPTVASGCVLAAVRSATPGLGHEESGAAPFTAGRWLFSHNGRLADWPGARKALADRVVDVAEATVPVDSALLFGLAAGRWAAGAGLAEGLRYAAAAAEDHGGGRLTMLAADGTRMAGLVAGEPLWLLAGEAGATLAAEPDSDDPRWRELAEGVVIEIARPGPAHPISPAPGAPPDHPLQPAAGASPAPPISPLTITEETR